jgi:hypothetical protein
LGGTRQEGNWNTDVDSQDKNRIWEGCVRLVPSLRVSIFTPVPRRGRGYTVLPLSVCPSFLPSKIFFVTFFSVTVDGRNMIFGHNRHIGIPYCG